MHSKGFINKQPPYQDEVVYLLDTIDGKEHLITEKNYEELKPLILKPELYGSFVANENTDREVVVPMKNIVAIRKDRREGSSA